jgi:uncharacterized membrane protein
MTKFDHLWAVVYEDTERAYRTREVVEQLALGPGHGAKYLLLLDMAVVVRHPDGSLTLDRKPFPGVGNVLASTGLGMLVGLFLAAPLSGAAFGAALGGLGTAASLHHDCIDEGFIRDVEALLTPGSSALFVLDNSLQLDVVLSALRGLGGTVVRTNVDMERAKAVQAALAAPAA